MTHAPSDDQLRVRTMAQLGLLDTPADQTFDRLARLTARLLGVPAAMLTLITAERQYLKGVYGIAEPWATSRETPLSHSFCQHVVAAGDSLTVANAREDLLVCASPAINELGLVAYLGLPLRAPSGAVLGAICAIDHRPRAWTDDDAALLADLAAMAETEIALRQTAADHARASQYQIAQRSAFDQIAAGGALTDLLSTLAGGIESQIDGVRCAVMLLDESRRHLFTAAAPSLPPAYCRTIAGSRIGPRAGSCGTAAFLGKPVVVADIATDPLWDYWRDLALHHGLRACWSVPVFDSAGQTLGTFALYHSEPRRPSELEFDLVLGAANVVSVAVERWRTIDALRTSEARLRRSEANLAAVFEHTDDAIWSVDTELLVVTINRPAVARLRAMTGAHVAVGAIFDEQMIDSQRVFWRGLYRRALAGERFSTEHPYLDGDAQRWCEISLNPIWVDAQIGGVSVFSRDLTERKRAEAERLEMERAWQETQRLESLGVLAGGIAHDFNNLLATILGNTELALLDTAATAPTYESLAQVELAARQAAAMTQQILAYAGKGRLTTEPLNLNGVVREMAALLRGTLLRQTPVIYRLAEDLPAIEGDAAQLHQVVMNLIVNAAEAIGGGRGDIRVTTDLRTLASGGGPGFEPPLAPGRYVCLEVADSGPGMSLATRARIFEPFFTTKFTGRGLGLAAVQGIVRGHSGALRVESALGVGTTFTLMFPLMAAPAGRAAGDAARLAPPPPSPRAGLVLVVDDDPAVCQITARMLRRIGYDVVEALSHDAAIGLLQAHHDQVSCILLDWTMPGRSGDAARHALHVASPQTPIVVMSGHSECAVIDAMTMGEPAGFLHKPFRSEDLRAVLDQAIRAA